MNVTSLTSWKSHDVVSNASFTRQICQQIRKWRHNFRDHFINEYGSHETRVSQGMTSPIALSTSPSSQSCVSAPRIGLVPPVPHCGLRILSKWSTSGPSPTCLCSNHVTLVYFGGIKLFMWDITGLVTFRWHPFDTIFALNPAFG
jgi:hypothetical protein